MNFSVITQSSVTQVFLYAGESQVIVSEKHPLCGERNLAGEEVKKFILILTLWFPLTNTIKNYFKNRNGLGEALNII